MKYKIQILTFLFGLLMIAPFVKADTPITGAAYGENIGLIHFDYITAINPFDECEDVLDTSPDTVNCPLHSEYSTYYKGPREDFYLSSISPYSDEGSLYYDPAYSARIGDAGTCTDDYCFLEGYLWSDEIGWIALNGQDIQNALSSAEFPENYFARISNANGVLSGYIWSEKTGWIGLSSEGFDYNSAQSASNWGLRMNFFSDPEDPLESTFCATVSEESECDDYDHICSWTGSACEAKSIEIGRKIEGFAWSEKLGWIKFHSEGEFFEGVYTTWIPDVDPPESHVDQDNIWFANDDENAILTWANFASDEDTGIDLEKTKFYIRSLTENCPPDINDVDTDPFNDSILSIEDPSAGVDVSTLKLTLQHLGRVSKLTEGYCKYELEAKITDGAGLTYYIDDPTDDTIEVPAGYDTGDPEKYRGTPITFFVRAGNYDSAEISANSSECVDPAALTAIADGEDCYEYRFEPVDIAGNPIVEVPVNRLGYSDTSENIMREVDVKYIFDSNIFFDQILPPPSGDHAVPASFDGTDLILQTDSDPVEYESILLDDTGSYPVQVNAFAPTTVTEGIAFDIDSAVITIRDEEMPAVTEFASKTDEVSSYDTTYDELITLSYSPALTVTSGSLDTDIIIPAVDAIASYTVENLSRNVTIDSFAVDSRLYFENAEGSDGYGKEVLDMRNIIAADNLTDDPYIGRTDPISGYTSYLLMTDNNDNQDNVFHTDSENIHPESYDFNYKYDIDTGLFTSSGIESSGQYDLFGIYDLTQDEKDEYYESISDPEIADITIDDIQIDRNDVFIGSGLAHESSLTFSFGLTPNQYREQPPTADVSFGADQYVAYKTPYFDRYTVFSVPSYIDGVEFKSLGLQATGQVTGENIYDTAGKDLDTVSATDSTELKRQIRSNVASITRNMDLESCGSQNLTGLPTDAGDCVIVDEINKTIVAVYTDNITLANDITVPDDYSYSLILKDGADLTIKGNILPGGSVSFGIITLADEDGDGGNVYIYPEPTDIHALLYAEGSIISRNADGDCYGTTGTCDLKNQLYWKGSIVSRNTIGGAPAATLPSGISKDEDCPGLDAFLCAQKYDMNYLRTFVLRSYVDETEGPIGHYAANGARYSGDNYCDTSATPPVCYFNGETTMTETEEPTNSLIDVELSKSTDTVFVEKDDKPAPPGFSTSAGYSSSQTIR